LDLYNEHKIENTFVSDEYLSIDCDIECHEVNEMDDSYLVEEIINKRKNDEIKIESSDDEEIDLVKPCITSKSQ